MEVKHVDFWGWRGLSLSAERVSLVVAPEVGGRIVSLKLDGVETLFSMQDLRGRCIDLSRTTDVRRKKRELGWLHYGGYKTWLAPQESWTDGLPFLDLDSGSYNLAVEENSEGAVVRVTSPVCRETGMQLTREVSISGNGRVLVEQAMINQSAQAANWGLWDVTQVRGPGMAVLPVAHSSRFEGGLKAYPGEGRSPEVVDRYVRLSEGLATVTCQQVEPFKYGTDSMEGWILGLLDRGEEHWLALLKVYEPIPRATYPHETTAEVYDSGSHPYFELEVHSPRMTLAPGASYGYGETWVLDWLTKLGGAQDLRGWVKKAMQGYT